MPQTITNIPCSLLRFCQFRSFGVIYSIHFLLINSFLSLRRLFDRLTAPSQSQNGHFLSIWSLLNDTNTPGTDKSLLSPCEFSWMSGAAFVQAWEWAWEKLHIYLLDKNGVQKNKAWFGWWGNGYTLHAVKKGRWRKKSKKCPGRHLLLFCFKGMWPTAHLYMRNGLISLVSVKEVCVLNIKKLSVLCFDEKVMELS